jgi:hypothetical protein
MITVIDIVLVLVLILLYVVVRQQAALNNVSSIASKQTDLEMLQQRVVDLESTTRDLTEKYIEILSSTEPRKVDKWLNRFVSTDEGAR